MPNHLLHQSSAEKKCIFWLPGIWRHHFICDWWRLTSFHLWLISILIYSWYLKSIIFKASDSLFPTGGQTVIFNEMWCNSLYFLCLVLYKCQNASSIIIRPVDENEDIKFVWTVTEKPYVENKMIFSVFENEIFLIFSLF